MQRRLLFISLAMLILPCGGLAAIKPDPQEPDPKVVAALEKRADLEFVKTPLKDVAAFLSEVHRIQFALDASATATSPISVKFKGVLKDGLKAMLDPYGLEFVVVGSKVVFRQKSKDK
jgi:hypothetical protein